MSVCKNWDHIYRRLRYALNKKGKQLTPETELASQCR